MVTTRFNWRGVVIVGLLILTGSTGGPARALRPEQPHLPCFPGTGVSGPPPYPARAFLPLVGSSGVMACALEVEPNDTHSAAQPVTGTCVAASAASSADADWYALRVCSPVTLTLRTTGPLTSPLDLDLYLHSNPPGVPLASSEGPSLDERLTTRLITGSYFALAQPAVDAGPYELWIEAQR